MTPICVNLSGLGYVAPAVIPNTYEARLPVSARLKAIAGSRHQGETVSGLQSTLSGIGVSSVQGIKPFPSFG